MFKSKHKYIFQFIFVFILQKDLSLNFFPNFEFCVMCTNMYFFNSFFKKAIKSFDILEMLLTK